MKLDPDTCYRALEARDARFDGLFFVGVKTTGIYCRPICTARLARRSSCAFFLNAAEAERASFRACFRCRPELAPGNANVDKLPRLVETAAGRIAAGALNELSVEELGAELGVSGRHLRRAMLERLGVSPVELAQSHRLGFAKRLLHDSSLPLAELAFASGFTSVRRFNALFARHFGRPPSTIRRNNLRENRGGVTLRLEYRPPLAWHELVRFLAVHATPGVEAVDVQTGEYARTVTLGAHRGWLRVRRHPSEFALIAETSLSLTPVLVTVVDRLRGLFDLDAQPRDIDDALVGDELFGDGVRTCPGLRVPGAFDGFETSVRTVLGQQVTVRGGTTLTGRLVEAFGSRLDTPFPELRCAFPTAAELADASEDAIARAVGLPKSRARSLIELGRAVAGGLRIERGAAVDTTTRRLLELPGIGPWTAEYLNMRVLGWPDAFPAADLVIQKVLGTKNARECAARAERFRPWRAYATVHLWRAA